MNWTLFFDIGNVLYFISLEKMCNQIAHLFSIPIEIVKLHLYDKEIIMKYESGTISTEEIIEYFSKSSKKTVCKKDFNKAISSVFTKPNNEIIPLIETLKNNNHTLILLSNTNEVHYRYLEKFFPILKLFDKTILSYKVGFIKPQREIFEIALSHGNNSSMFYTDDIKENIDAARNTGLDCEIFTTVSLLKDHLLKRKIIT
jgi:glucose-1-phosphatase